MQKHILLILICGLAMSATKCEKKEPRLLKKNISIAYVEASTFMNSSAFNFAEQAKERYSAALFTSPYFYERNSYPTPIEYFKSDQIHIQTKIQNQSPKTQINPLKLWFPQLYDNNQFGALNFNGDNACLVTRPQHLIAAKVLSLEAHSGGSLVFGFSQSFAQLPLQASFSVDRMKMDMITNAFDPWTKERTQSQLVSVFKKDMALKIGIDLGIINIGPEIYRKTELAEVTQQLVTESVKKMGLALNETPGQEWTSRIFINQDNYVAFVGGEELGIRIGDQFIVENQNHQWIGKPCETNSILVSSLPTTLNPWTIEVDRVGLGISRAKVVTSNEHEQIQIGALVKIKKLVEETNPDENN